ncbi:E3 ubiquitin-protein ligase Midline-1-like [Saccostrea echinata]|uniref:E3 ubiquitin-protein ligase Midline-1-like n=1 Tax=Saccostrea echinata TaxID=191078 RepID=UPI002A7EC1F1|nr:E3 ubiquitin-protein ligase Midline-1-like [Saccostrea echinata]
MATGTPFLHEKLDLTMCSICLENFKSPRYLPCAHTFCHTCLSTRIKAICTTNDDDQQLGFPCPLCRAFVPAPGAIGRFPLDKWVSQFPENEHVGSLVRKGGGLSLILCNPCNREGEENEASRWCQECAEALCEDCLKYHKKIKSTLHHETVPIGENFTTLVPSQRFNMDICEIHEGRKIDMFCKCHFTPCCVLCATKEHGSCQRLCPIEEVAEKLIGAESIQFLQDGIGRLDRLLETVIKEEKINLVDIDDVADKIVNDITKTKDKAIESVKRLEEKHLNEVAKLSKDAKAKLEKSIEALEQRRCYLQYWKEATSKNLSPEESSESEFVLSYIKLAQIFKDLRKLDISKLEVGIKSTIHKSVGELIELPSLGEIYLMEGIKSLMLNETNIKHAEAQMISEFKIDVDNLRGGVYLRNNELIVTDYSKKRSRLIRCKTDGLILKEVTLKDRPWDVSLYDENHIYVTLPDVKAILLLNTDSLNIVKRIDSGYSCFGMSQSGNTIAIGCQLTLKVLDKDFQNIRSSSDLRNMYDVAVNVEENIIYSSYTDHIIRKEDRKGNVLFTYYHEELKSPYGLTVDRHGIIYVNGHKSNNIHILSPDGENLRILKGVKEPLCIKFQENSNRFFVAETGGTVKIFEFTT